MADVGRRRSPLLFGRISIRPHPADEKDPLLPDEEPLWGWEEQEHTQHMAPVLAEFRPHRQCP